MPAGPKTLARWPVGLHAQCSSFVNKVEWRKALARNSSRINRPKCSPRGPLKGFFSLVCSMGCGLEQWLHKRHATHVTARDPSKKAFPAVLEKRPYQEILEMGRKPSGRGARP